MKFGKEFAEYVKELHGRRPQLGFSSFVGFHCIKELLRICRLQIFADIDPSPRLLPNSARSPAASDPLQASPSVDCTSARDFLFGCQVCDCTLLPLLIKEVAAVSRSFNTRTQQLLQRHHASGLQKYLMRIKHKYAGNHLAEIEEGELLMNYLAMNALAVRKVLTKYDKIVLEAHSFKEKPLLRFTIKSQLQAIRVQLLQSPWLIELIAFHFNSNDSGITQPGMCTECSCDFESGKSIMTCMLHELLRMDFDLTCSICLETVFDPVSLSCGHIFCNSCVCSAASISTIQGLKAAHQHAKCPLCRQAGVYTDAVHLRELAKLISNRCKDYWVGRLTRERAEQLKAAKRHWENQCRAAVGF